MGCQGHERELPTGIFGGSVTNQSDGYNGGTASVELQGDASNAVLRAVGIETLLGVGFVAANLGIRIGCTSDRKAQHAAQQQQGAEAQRERAIDHLFSNRCLLHRCPCNGCRLRQYDGSEDKGPFQFG